MIEYIKGEIAELHPAQLILESNGIGYVVHISLSTHAALSGAKNCKVYIYEQIREDAHELFGFSDKPERELFVLLISVSGVGAQTARMILSSYSAAELESAIASGDVSALQSVKGIGGKTAQRIIVDLKDKISVDAAMLSKELPAANSKVADEAVSALSMLGFTSSLSRKAVNSILKQNPGIPVEQVVKAALKML